MARDGVALGVLLLALGMIYRQVFVGRVLAGGDLHLYFYPYWMAMTRAFHERTSLLWNPYLFAGAPLLANSQVGVLYPLNWPFWWLASPGLGEVAQALHGSVLLHVVLAAVNAYALTRMVTELWMPATDEPRPGFVAHAGAVIAALIYAGSGFLAVHLEHLNQLQALAWLPLCFLPRSSSSSSGVASRGARPPVVAIVAFTMILLAGHTQMAFIAALGLTVWYGVQALESAWATSARFDRSEGRPQVSRRAPWVATATAMVATWAGLLAPFALAGLLAGAQLVPSLQLAQLSGRSADYAWREAASFSLPPWQLPRALLPPYVTAPLLPEGVAYTGVLALILAGMGARAVLRRRKGIGPFVLALAGIFLATGGYNPFYLALVRLGVPGFAHFRAPARFLSLFVLGVAILAGLGFVKTFRARERRPGTVLALAGALLLGVTLELWIGGQTLPYAAATTLRAYTDLRPATAHLVATARAGEDGNPAGHRFLSISQTLFEVGDKDEVEGLYGDALPADAVWAYMVASKQREVLAPNLPLAFQVPAVDGYDGGLLPLRSYSTFSRLLLPEGTPDGRLRENLATIPERRWLDALGVRYVLTDKTGDVWIDDVLYDRQFHPVLEEGDTLRVAWLPEGFAADGLRLLYTGAGEVVVEFLDGREVRAELSRSTGPDAAQSIGWEGAAAVVGLQIHATGGPLALSGASLVDERLGSFYPLVLSDAFRLVHSGDVKIYEMLSPPPRAFLVYEAQTVTSAEEALLSMRSNDFDPLERVLLVDETGGSPVNSTSPPQSAPLRSQDEHVEVIDYTAARVVIEVVTGRAGYLVLTDAWYPGWAARITTQSDAGHDSTTFTTPVLQADLLFQAVTVRPGRWRVTLSYLPWVMYAGIGLSLLGCGALGVYQFVVLQHRHTLNESFRHDPDSA